jgi:HSP20 family protein
MTLTRWQRPELGGWALDHLNQLRNEMNRVFDSPFDGFGRGQFFNNWVPALDVHQDRDNVVVRAELPGMKKEDIDVSLHDGTLTISGERKHEEKGKEADSYRSERFFGRFQRSISLPVSVDVGKVAANYKDGILTVTLPKTEEAKPKQIAVNVTGGESK